MAEAYRKRWREVKEVTDDFLRMERVGGWLEKYGRCQEIRKVLLYFLIQICIRRYRKDVFASIKGEIRTECRTEAIQGKFMLCQYELERIRIDQETGEELAVWIVRGNKMAYKSLGPFIDFLWDYNDGKERKHWEDKGYRTLYQRSVRIVGRLLNERYRKRFRRNLKQLFILNN